MEPDMVMALAEEMCKGRDLNFSHPHSGRTSLTHKISIWHDAREERIDLELREDFIEVSVCDENDLEIEYEQFPIHDLDPAKLTDLVFKRFQKILEHEYQKAQDTVKNTTTVLKAIKPDVSRET